MYHLFMLIAGHAAKNAGGQATSPVRTLHFGLVWTDFTGPRGHGLPAAAFVRADSQSDALQALLSNPFFCVAQVDGPIEMLQVPWHSRGVLLWSVSTAMTFAPCLHKGMDVAQRCEVAMTGYLVWDLWRLCSARQEAKTSSKVGSMSMSSQTASNLQCLSLSIVVLLLTKEDLL